MHTIIPHTPLDLTLVAERLLSRGTGLAVLVVSWEEQAGKSFLCRALCERLPRRIVVAGVPALRGDMFRVPDGIVLVDGLTLSQATAMEVDQARSTVDGAVLIMRPGGCSSSNLQQAAERLVCAGLPLFGFVFNEGASRPRRTTLGRGLSIATMPEQI